MDHRLSNSICYIPPKGDFITFENEEAYIVKGTEWKLFTERSVKKELVYKSNGHQEKVKLVGYEDYGGSTQTIVVEFEDGSLSCIHPAYLKEMQSSSFGKDLLTDETTVTIDSSVEQVKEKPEKKPTSKAKKEPAQPKLVLPEDKVHFTAIVKEFTVKMNHFTGEEDEVILLEHVKIEGEQELEIGDAWCGYSKTLKKAELAEGDLLEFDGKIVDKKFDKAIRYKINNPSKLKKITTS